MSLSNTVEHEMLLDFLTRHPNLFVAMSTASPGEAGAGIAEPTAESYIRVSAGSVTLTDNLITNDATINFPVASEAWGTLGWVALFDAEEGGVFLGSAEIDPIDCIILTQISIPAETPLLSLD